MLNDSQAFGGFAVDDTAKAKDFYSNILGLTVTQHGKHLKLTLKSGAVLLVYRQENFVPAGYTILNFPVANIEQTVDELTAKGVQFEHYEGALQTDEKGIFYADDSSPEQGPDNVAWFKDPAGNLFAVFSGPGPIPYNQ